MAKVVKKRRRPKGNDLSLQSVELCPGLVIDTRIKMGAIWYLEDKFDKPIAKMKLDSGRIKDMAFVIVALAMQHNPELTEANALDLFKQLTPEQARTASKAIEGAFAVTAKNSRGAGQLLENQKG